jgi:hypothetical protein
MPYVRWKDSKRFSGELAHIWELVPKPNLILTTEVLETIDENRELPSTDLDVQLP